jgi:hypothetical protein
MNLKKKEENIMNKVQLQIKKSSHGLDILFQIMRIVVYVGLGVSAASVLYLLCGGPGHIGSINIYSGLSFNDNVINSREALVANLPEIGRIITWMVLLQLIFYRIGGLFHDTAESASPFTEKNVKRILFSAVVLIAAGILPNLVEIVLAFATGNKTVSVELLNMAVMAIGVVMLGLSQIFDYGTQLQKLSDETL